MVGAPRPARRCSLTTSGHQVPLSWASPVLWTACWTQIMQPWFLNMGYWLLSTSLMIYWRSASLTCSHSVHQFVLWRVCTSFRDSESGYNIVQLPASISPGLDCAKDELGLSLNFCQEWTWTFTWFLPRVNLDLVWIVYWVFGLKEFCRQPDSNPGPSAPESSVLPLDHWRCHHSHIVIKMLSKINNVIMIIIHIASGRVT